MIHEELIDLQLNQDFEMESEAHASVGAKKLVDLLTKPNPSRRISVNRALMDDWLRMEPIKTVEKKEQPSPYHRIANHARPEQYWECASLSSNQSISITDSISNEVLYHHGSKCRQSF